MDKYGDFTHFFYPETVVVFGVSTGEMNLGKNIVLNTVTQGFEGEVLSIGNRDGVVLGQKIHQSLDEIDRRIDLAVILTPARSIPEILDHCGRKGIKNVVIESGGFSELGKEGRLIEEACHAMAKKHGIRFIGPNCIGVMNLENGLATPFMALQKGLSLGPVSIMSQSGGVGLSYLSFLVDEHIGCNKFISMGNKLDVDENELLDYLIRDEGTKIIVVYLEGFVDGRRFVEVARCSHKPILVYKSNRFKESASIAQSHTTALFTDDRLVDFALEQAGCIRLNNMDDAMDYIKSLTMPFLKGKNLAIVSRSGGHAVIAADACSYYGFSLTELPQELLHKFESRFRAHVIRLQNPLDLGDLFELEFYVYILDELLKRDDVDGILLGHGYFRGVEQEPSRVLLRRVEQLVEQYQKPVAPVILTEAKELDYLRESLNIPIFYAPENAMRALKFSYQWSNKKSILPEILTEDGLDREKAGEIIRGADGRPFLFLSEALELLDAYGFPVPPFLTADTQDESISAWKKLENNVAMKINRPHISHKTDSNALSLNLGSEEQVTEALRNLKKIGGEGTEILLQPMIAQGQELILGGKKDAVFGHAILFGLGGVFVELLEDVAWRIAPVSHEEARKMINSIRAIEVLKGFRGHTPFDLEAIEHLLVRLSHLLMDFPIIKEIDINPIVVFERGEGALALDARVVLSDE